MSLHKYVGISLPSQSLRKNSPCLGLWFVCKEAKDRLPRQDIVLTPKTENRLFFVDERYEQGFPSDENESFYIGKSIAGLKLNQSAQNPITYLYPLEKDKIHI